MEDLFGKANGKKHSTNCPPPQRGYESPRIDVNTHGFPATDDAPSPVLQQQDTTHSHHHTQHQDNNDIPPPPPAEFTTNPNQISVTVGDGNETTPGGPNDDIYGPSATSDYIKMYKQQVELYKHYQQQHYQRQQQLMHNMNNTMTKINSFSPKKSSVISEGDEMTGDTPGGPNDQNDSNAATSEYIKMYHQQMAIYHQAQQSQMNGSNSNFYTHPNQVNQPMRNIQSPHMQQQQYHYGSNTSSNRNFNFSPQFQQNPSQSPQFGAQGLVNVNSINSNHNTNSNHSAPINPHNFNKEQEIGTEQEEWIEVNDETTGKNYWYHKHTKETTWTHPNDKNKHQHQHSESDLSSVQSVHISIQETDDEDDDDDEEEEGDDDDGYDDADDDNVHGQHQSNQTMVYNKNHQKYQSGMTEMTEMNLDYA